MAKTKTRSSVSPAVFGLGSTIFFEDVRVVPEAQAYAAGEVVEAFSMPGGQTYDAGSKSIPFVDAEDVLAFTIWVPPHATTIGIETSTSGAGTGSIDVDIEGTTTNISTGANQTDTVATSTVGTGALEVTVTTNLSSGSLELTQLTLRTAAIAAASIPDPVNE